MPSFKWLVATIVVGVTSVNAQCDPLVNGTCAPIQGIKSTVSTDFTKLAAPNGLQGNADWTIANYENVTIDPSLGAVFSLAKQGDAPYLWTTGYFLYGRASVTMKTAPGVGVITSAVLYSDTKDEIDWEFSGNDYARSQPTLQTNWFGRGITGNWDRNTYNTLAWNATKDFHTYTLDWTAESLTWSVDGAVIRTLLRKDCIGQAYQYPQTPARLHIGVWDAGAPNVAAGTVAWAGGYTDLNGFPYNAYVKSVEVVPQKGCAYYNYTDSSGNEASVACLSALPDGNSTSAASASAASASSLSPSSQAAVTLNGASVPATALQNATSSTTGSFTSVTASLSVAGTHNAASTTGSGTVAASISASAAPDSGDDSEGDDSDDDDSEGDDDSDENDAEVDASKVAGSKGDGSEGDNCAEDHSDADDSNDEDSDDDDSDDDDSDDGSDDDDSDDDNVDAKTSFPSSTGPRAAKLSSEVTLQTSPPIAGAPSPVVEAAKSAVSSLTPYVSTIYETKIYSITRCPANVASCPASSTSLRTEVAAYHTTVYATVLPGKGFEALPSAAARATSAAWGAADLKLSAATASSVNADTCGDDDGTDDDGTDDDDSTQMASTATANGTDKQNAAAATGSVPVQVAGGSRTHGSGAGAGVILLMGLVWGVMTF